MSEELGKIAVKKIPASQAIPGNAEHAKLMRQAGINTPGRDEWASKINTSMRKPTLIGLIIVAAFFLLFGLWAIFAPLAGAAVAQGVVAASGQNLRVQHFEGGIIEEILVREGEVVEKGQSLMTLDATDARATRDRYKNLLIGLHARAERLQAERDGVVFEFSEELVEKARQSELLADLQEQMREFEKRSLRYASDAKIVDQQIAALNEQIAGLVAQTTSTKSQIQVLEEEIAVKAKLVKRRLTPRSELLRLQRNRSELEGRLGEFQSQIGEAKSSIVRSQEQKLNLQAERSETAVTQLNEVRSRISETTELVRSAENVLERVVIRSPAQGTVVTISKNTPGSVVRRAEELLVLLPGGGDLIVEARLSPQDIDVVNIGQSASLRFSSLNTRTTPEVIGTVTYVSADRQLDSNTNEPYYTARLKFADTLPSNFNRNQIFPGMPVETYIETGDRTFLQYLAKPITDSFSRAFREG